MRSLLFIVILTTVIASPCKSNKHPPIPSFFRTSNLTTTAVNEFINISSNSNVSYAQMNTNLMNWATKYGLQNQMAQLQANKTALRNTLRKNMNDFMSALSNARKKLDAVLMDDTLTPTQRIQKLKDIHNMTDPDVNYVLAVIVHRLQLVRWGLTGKKGSPPHPNAPPPIPPPMPPKSNSSTNASSITNSTSNITTNSTMISSNNNSTVPHSNSTLPTTTIAASSIIGNLTAPSNVSVNSVPAVNPGIPPIPQAVTLPGNGTASNSTTAARPVH